MTPSLTVSRPTPHLIDDASGVWRQVPADTLARSDRGVYVGGVAINLCGNANAAPADLGAVAKLGDPAATLALVDDSAAMTGPLAALLADGVLNGNAYRLNNSGGAGDAQVLIAGAVADLTEHTASAFLRGTGSARLGVTGTPGGLIALGAGYVRAAGAVTPAAVTDELLITAAAGADVYFVLNQLEAGPIAKPPIVTG